MEPQSLKAINIRIWGLPKRQRLFLKRFLILAQISAIVGSDPTWANFLYHLLKHCASLAYASLCSSKSIQLNVKDFNKWLVSWLTKVIPKREKNKGENREVIAAWKREHIRLSSLEIHRFKDCSGRRFIPFVPSFYINSKALAFVKGDIFLSFPSRSFINLTSISKFKH